MTPSRPTPDRDGPPAQRKPQGTTHTADEAREPAPRLPHEHDESADSAAKAPDPEIRQAHDDLERGLVDTDRGRPMDEAYRKQKQR
ncbi:hypothetical protein V4F39_13915 [Aquincola sp. MAHUQ-54]|uniref:Prokaryotic ubiquitin-like protein UBact n=1 Tax=Aquincola agrisoli TaxID=3119538 RepID=A0AAW9Q4S8_9BURK